LLDVLDVLSGVEDQHLALAHVAAQDDDLVGKPEGLLQQARAVQPLNPLTIVDISLGTPLGMGYGSGVDQEDAKAAPFQQFVQGDPGDAGGFQGDGIDAAVSQPVSEGFEVGGESPKPADRLGISVGWDANPMDAVVDVDPGGVGILNGQGRAA